MDRTVESPLPCCPHCQGEVKDPRKIEQYVVDIPPVKPLVTRIITTQAFCPRCKCPVRSTHPEQVSEATGAAGVHFGARALALAAQLRHGFGLTLPKTCGVLKTICAVDLTPGGLSQALERIANKLKGNYEHLTERLRNSAVVHADETSWWVGGASYSLWVMCNEQTTLYRVVPKRDRATFHETIPAQYAGVLVTDCLSVYDTATPIQHKCYAHHLRAIGQARNDKGEPHNRFLCQCENLLLTAMEQSKQCSELNAEQKQQRTYILHTAANALLDTPRSCPYEECIRVRLHKQRDHLFTFLEYEGVDATNNLAERQLRPAVISRKLSCGNKTERGARSWEVLASLAATAQQNSQSLLDIIIPAFAR